MITSTIEVWSDGSSLRNPGPSGCSYVIRYWVVPEDKDAMPEEKTIEWSQNYRLSTNNRMELMAAIYGLERVITGLEDLTFEGCTQVNVLSDSEYVSKPINNKWIDKWQTNGWMTSAYNGKQSKPVSNQDLWQQLLASQTKLRSLGVTITYNHVPGHAGNELNERCDQLARDASGNTVNPMFDTVYENAGPRY